MSELVVSKQSILELLGKPNQKFVIPDYQRPYSWGIEQCQRLWNDVTDFEKMSASDDELYFLGPIVMCPYSDERQLAVIDGQQRITTLLLLLRAFYSQLATTSRQEDADYLRHNIASCIWDLDRITGRENKDRPKLTSMAISEEEFQDFVSIMRDGKANQGDKSRYAENYRFFVERCADFAKTSPMQWKTLCLCFLDRCIVLPIEAQNQDSALTIFSTLNDRGLQLCDSDIFKAQLYKAHPEDERSNFSNEWQTLIKGLNKNPDYLFRNYMHYLRATEEDVTNERALRKYYAPNGYARLRNNPQQIMTDLLALRRFWHALYTYSDDYCTHRSKQMLHCLWQQYPNEYWRYPLTVLYLRNRDEKTEAIRARIDELLPRLLAYLFTQYIKEPGSNAVKSTIYQACKNIWHEGYFAFPKHDISLNRSLIKPQFRKALLLLHAYLIEPSQKLLTAHSPIEIEHIFPRKYETSHFDWSKQDEATYLDNIGNLVIIDQLTNIRAGNDFFSAKKDKYQKSDVVEVQRLCDYDQWDKKEILEREQNIYDRLNRFFENHCA